MKPLHSLLLFILLLSPGLNAATIPHPIVLDMRHGLKESRIRAVTPLPDGAVAVATTATIDIFDGNTFRTADILKSNEYFLKSSDGYREIFHTLDSILWIKNYHSLHAFHLADLSPITSVGTLLEDYGISYAPINVYVSGGRLFTVSPEGKLYESDGKTNRLITRLPQISTEEISPQKIATDDTFIYLCYKNGHLHIVKANDGETIYSGSVPASDEIQAYSRGINVCLHNGFLYYSRHNDAHTVSEISIFNIREKEWIAKLRIPFRVSDFDFDRQGNCIVVGNKGYIIYSPDLRIIESSDRIQLDNSLIYDDFSSISTDISGSIWIGTSENGLLYSNPRRQRLFTLSAITYPYPQPPVFASEKLKNLAEKYASGITNCSATDSLGYSYLGTRNGLMVFDPADTHVGTLDLAHGLSSSNIQAILCTSYGIYATNSDNVIRLTHRKSHFEINSYGILDGISLNGKEFRGRQLAIGTEGRIYIGSPLGCYIFNPDSLPITGRPSHILYLASSQPKDNASVWIFFTILGALLSFTLGLPFLKESGETAIRTDNISQNKNTDPEFVSKLTELIVSNMDNTELSVTQLSSMMAMERTVLYRKSQTNIGMSPSAYIKTLRIREASQLLCETDLLIADIASRTGFSTSKYFTQAFKEITGVTPSGYRSRHRHSSNPSMEQQTPS